MSNLIVDLSYFFLITLISFYFSGINWLYLAITAVHLITQFIKVACQVKFQSVEVAKYMYDQCVLSMHILRYPPTNSYFFYCKTCKWILFGAWYLNLNSSVLFAVRQSAQFSQHFLFRKFVQFSDCSTPGLVCEGPIFNYGSRLY